MNFDAAEPGEAAHRKDSEEEGFIGGDYEYAKAARKRLWGKSETVDNFSDRGDGLSAGGSEPPQTTGNTEEGSDAADDDLRMNEPAGADAEGRSPVNNSIFEHVKPGSRGALTPPLRPFVDGAGGKSRSNDRNGSAGTPDAERSAAWDESTVRELLFESKEKFFKCIDAIREANTDDTTARWLEEAVSRVVDRLEVSPQRRSADREVGRFSAWIAEHAHLLNKLLCPTPDPATVLLSPTRSKIRDTAAQAVDAGLASPKVFPDKSPEYTYALPSGTGSRRLKLDKAGGAAAQGGYDPLAGTLPVDSVSPVTTPRRVLIHAMDDTLSASYNGLQKPDLRSSRSISCPLPPDTAQSGSQRAYDPLASPCRSPSIQYPPLFSDISPVPRRPRSSQGTAASWSQGTTVRTSYRLPRPVHPLAVLNRGWPSARVTSESAILEAQERARRRSSSLHKTGDPAHRSAAAAAVPSQQQKRNSLLACIRKGERTRAADRVGVVPEAVVAQASSMSRYLNGMTDTVQLVRHPHRRRSGSASARGRPSPDESSVLTAGSNRERHNNYPAILHRVPEPNSRSLSSRRRSSVATAGSDAAHPKRDGSTSPPPRAAGGGESLQFEAFDAAAALAALAAPLRGRGAPWSQRLQGLSGLFKQLTALPKPQQAGVPGSLFSVGGKTYEALMRGSVFFTPTAQAAYTSTDQPPPGNPASDPTPDLTFVACALAEQLGDDRVPILKLALSCTGLLASAAVGLFAPFAAPVVLPKLLAILKTPDLLPLCTQAVQCLAIITRSCVPVACLPMLLHAANEPSPPQNPATPNEPAEGVPDEFLLQPVAVELLADLLGAAVKGANETVTFVAWLDSGEEAKASAVVPCGQSVAAVWSRFAAKLRIDPRSVRMYHKSNIAEHPPSQAVTFRPSRFAQYLQATVHSHRGALVSYLETQLFVGTYLGHSSLPSAGFKAGTASRLFWLTYLLFPDDAESIYLSLSPELQAFVHEHRPPTSGVIVPDSMLPANDLAPPVYSANPTRRNLFAPAAAPQQRPLQARPRIQVKPGPGPKRVTRRR